MLGRQTGVSTWVAETVVGRRRRGAAAGLAAYFDPVRAAGIDVIRSNAIAWVRNPPSRGEGGRGRATLGAVRIDDARAVALRVSAQSGRRLTFEMRNRGGWAPVAGPYVAPGWLNEARVVLRVAGGTAAFEGFTLGPVGPSG